jgi:hypothetical protein
LKRIFAITILLVLPTKLVGENVKISTTTNASALLEIITEHAGDDGKGSERLEKYLSNKNNNEIAMEILKLYDSLSNPKLASTSELRTCRVNLARMNAKLKGLVEMHEVEKEMYKNRETKLRKQLMLKNPENRPDKQTLTTEHK